MDSCIAGLQVKGPLEPLIRLAVIEIVNRSNQCQRGVRFTEGVIELDRPQRGRLRLRHHLGGRVVLVGHKACAAWPNYCCAYYEYPAHSVLITTSKVTRKTNTATIGG